MKIDAPKIALIGCGYWGKNLARNFHDLSSLNAICEVDKNQQFILHQQYPACRIVESFAEILADDQIAAVAIATPADSHADLVRAALLKDKDVFVEKPLCLNAATGRELVSLARERKRILMVGHLLQYHPGVSKLKELIASGALGHIQYIYSNRLNLGKIRREENILWSFAPHDISVILALVGQMPCEVQAQGGNYLHDRIADITVSLLSFPNGIKAHVFVSWLHPFKEQKLVVVGDRQMAVFDDLQSQDKLVLYAHSIVNESKDTVPTIRKAMAEAVPLDDVEPLRSECSHFLHCIESRARPLTDGEEGLRVLTVLEQCQEALEAYKKEYAGGR